MGGVQGTREILEQLFSKQFHVLVYPGGSHETFKKKEEAYQLQWGNRLGFVKMAIQFGVPIIMAHGANIHSGGNAELKRIYLQG